MEDINERLREAARTGSEAELKALLRDPGCDALAKDSKGRTALMWAACMGDDPCVQLLLPVSDARAKNKNGQTALMYAAYREHEACIRLLLPVSDALAKDEAGRTSSCWAKDGGHESLSQFIDAYALSQTEQASIGGAARSSPPRKRAAPRV